MHIGTDFIILIKLIKVGKITEKVNIMARIFSWSGGRYSRKDSQPLHPFRCNLLEIPLLIDTFNITRHQ